MTDLYQVLVCPYCQDELKSDLKCNNCGITFPGTSDRPDLRLTRPVQITTTYNYTPEFGYFPWEKVILAWPDAANGVTRKADWENFEWEILKSIPRPSASGLLALDLGCGLRKQRFKLGLQEMGYDCIGIDIDGPAPDALADAHSLPFKSESFDLITSSAVFEHLKNPFVAMKELYRVAKPGARIHMTIAFTEPFHISYFHHSPLASNELLASIGLDPEVFILSAEWHTFNANFRMGFAGKRMPLAMQDIIAGFIKNYSLLPAKIKSVMKGRHHYNAALNAFARSHSGFVGIIAHKKK